MPTWRDRLKGGTWRAGYSNPNHPPGKDAEANVEASPEPLAVREWDLPRLLGQFQAQKCLHGVIPGPALSYDVPEGVKAENKLVWRWTWTLIVPRGAAMRRRRPDQLTGWADRAAS